MPTFVGVCRVIFCIADIDSFRLFCVFVNSPPTNSRLLAIVARSNLAISSLNSFTFRSRSASFSLPTTCTTGGLIFGVISLIELAMFLFMIAVKNSSGVWAHTSQSNFLAGLRSCEYNMYGGSLEQ